MLKYLLLLIIISLIGAKYYQVTKKDSTPIDVMAIHLAPVKKLLHTGSSIGFYSNALPDSAKVMYVQALFVLQPVIIKPAKADTMLLIVDKNHPVMDFKNYTLMAKTGDAHFIYSLLAKNK